MRAIAAAELTPRQTGILFGLRATAHLRSLLLTTRFVHTLQITSGIFLTRLSDRKL
jgi:hypothetical protein